MSRRGGRHGERADQPEDPAGRHQGGARDSQAGGGAPLSHSTSVAPSPSLTFLTWRHPFSDSIISHVTLARGLYSSRYVQSVRHVCISFSTSLSPVGHESMRFKKTVPNKYRTLILFSHQKSSLVNSKPRSKRLWDKNQWN